LLRLECKHTSAKLTTAAFATDLMYGITNESEFIEKIVIHLAVLTKFWEIPKFYTAS
jgi:hypothetical protein